MKNEAVKKIVCSHCKKEFEYDGESQMVRCPNCDTEIIFSNSKFEKFSDDTKKLIDKITKEIDEYENSNKN